MIGKATLVLSIALMSATSANASEPTNRSDARLESNRMVCRTETDTGSRLGKSRACHTVAEWAELRRQMKKKVDEIQSRKAANLSN